MEIKNSVAIVTGGASGLGEASVRSLVKNGARVSIFDIDEERAGKIVAELGESVLFFGTDVTNEEAVRVAVDKTIDSFGGLHIAITCAGVGGSVKVISDEGSFMDHFNRVVQINLMGPMNVTRLTAKKMVRNTPNEDGERGVIINTSSAAAFDGRIGQAAYSASKAAVVGMTLPIAREFFDYGIRIMTIAPGLFETPMWYRVPAKARESITRMRSFPKREGKPSEFALLVQQIIENPMMNGCTIRLDGGRRMS